MKHSARWAAAFVLMFLLPVQGLAATCAQICAKAQASQHALSAAEDPAGHHCHDSGDGRDDGVSVPDSKCCHAHAFMVEPPAVTAGVAPPSFQALPFVARWTSFIPEEPSPPPIASAA
jgi:hypothetical protein